MEVRYETDICQYFTASMIMQLLAMHMLNSADIFIREIIYYITNPYNTLNQSFSYTTESWYLVLFLVEEMFRSDFVSVKANMISTDVVNNPKACSGIFLD